MISKFNLTGNWALNKINNNIWKIWKNDNGIGKMLYCWKIFNHRGWDEWTAIVQNVAIALFYQRPTNKPTKEGSGTEGEHSNGTSHYSARFATLIKQCHKWSWTRKKNVVAILSKEPHWNF